MTPKKLEQNIRSLLNQPMPDAALREQLEKLAAAEISFSGFTWLFGPELYRRNRMLFLSPHGGPDGSDSTGGRTTCQGILPLSVRNLGR